MIKFWRIRGEKYGAFSNFFSAKINIDGKEYKSVEHYYQSQKTLVSDDQERIRSCGTAKEAKALACSVYLREDWEQVKNDIMRKGVLAKFSQHEGLKELLLSTGEEEIGEDSPYDYVWGLGKDGTGENRLGKILMEVRDFLKTPT